jgi:hypothetical protein
MGGARLTRGLAGKLSAVNVAETLLVFVGAPLAVVVLLALLIYLPGGRKRPRYKAGQAWEHEPIWYEPHPESGPSGGHGDTHALSDGHGTDDATASASRPVSAGPLGGARGTW